MGLAVAKGPGGPADWAEEGQVPLAAAAAGAGGTEAGAAAVLEKVTEVAVSKGRSRSLGEAPEGGFCRAVPAGPNRDLKLWSAAVYLGLCVVRPFQEAFRRSQAVSDSKLPLRRAPSRGRLR